MLRWNARGGCAQVLEFFEVEFSKQAFAPWQEGQWEALDRLKITYTGAGAEGCYHPSSRVGSGSNSKASSLVSLLSVSVPPPRLAMNASFSLQQALADPDDAHESMVLIRCCVRQVLQLCEQH